jgi:transposase InsO family protein
MDFYNERRPHSSLDDRTPEEAYTDGGAARRLGLRPASSQPEEEAA